MEPPTAALEDKLASEKAQLDQILPVEWNICVFYAMNLGMHVDRIGDSDLKILVIKSTLTIFV